MYLYINVYVEKTKNNDLYFVALEFNDNCINTVSCDATLHLQCSINKCLCVSNYYHKEQVCYASMCIHLFNISA